MENRITDAKGSAAAHSASDPWADSDKLKLAFAAHDGLAAWSSRLIAASFTVTGAIVVWLVLDNHARAAGVGRSAELTLTIILLLIASATAGGALVLRAMVRYADKQVRSFALRDALTHVGSRALLFERLDHALSRRGSEAKLLAVLFLDMDRFKVVNDNLGHNAGDKILTTIARKLEACLRPADTVARFGGDEFVVLLEDLEGPSAAARVAARIMSALEIPVKVDGRHIFITASIGVALGRPSHSTSGDLLRQADLALYHAKSQGRSRFVVFDSSLSADLDQIGLEGDLHGALERGELRLCYQPEVNIETGEIVGVEALLRWQHPSRGLLLPASFLSTAEDSGALNAIGIWVLEEACKQLRRWQDRYQGRPHTMSVNLSVRQLQQPDLAKRVEKALNSCGVDPAYLKLEITESVFLDEAADARDALAALKAMGVHLAIDDFGSGYSSFSYLRKLPVDTVKIDQSFVAGLGMDEANQLIVQAIVTLAHDLKLDVTAEGVETAEQLAFLQEVRCDRAQGFYLARPLSAEEMEPLLAFRWLPQAARTEAAA